MNQYLKMSLRKDIFAFKTIFLGIYAYALFVVLLFRHYLLFSFCFKCKADFAIRWALIGAVINKKSVIRIS